MRAKSLAARQSGRSAASDGRRMPPANTSSVTLLSRSKARPAAAAPMRHQACGTSCTVAGSADPSRARTKTSRPAVRQDSTRRRGSPPLPATIPSLPSIRPLRLADGAARIGTNEIDDVVDRSDTGETLCGFGHAITQSAFGREQELIGVAQLLNVLPAEPSALHTDDVEPVKPGPFPHHLPVGDDVALDARHAADHGVLADTHVLVDGAKPAENGILLDDNMTRDRRIVRHDHVIGNLTVMGDVRADHEKAVVADPRDHTPPGRPGVHRNMFANRVVAPDHKLGLFTPIFEILRFEPDRGKGKDARALADDRPAVNDRMRAEGDPSGERDVLADNAIGSDDDIL